MRARAWMALMVAAGCSGNTDVANAVDTGLCGDAHGATAQLTDGQIDDLVAYLRSL